MLLFFFFKILIHIFYFSSLGYISAYVKSLKINSLKTAVDLFLREIFHIHPIAPQTIHE